MVGDGYVPTVTRSRRRVRYCPGMPIIAWICLICIFLQISQAGECFYGLEIEPSSLNLD